MDRRDISDAAADAIVLEALRARRGEATRADLEVATSLGDMVVERAVSRLAGEYESSIGVAAGGALVYHFDPSFRRRRERDVFLRAVLAWSARAAATVGHAARTLFRIALALQLIVYTFVICLPVSAVIGAVVGVVVLIVGALSGSPGDVLDLISDPYALLTALVLAMLGGIGWALYKEYDLILELVGARKLKSRQQGLGALVTRVNAFAVGPEPPAGGEDRLDRTFAISRADERCVLARVRTAGGVLRAGHLVDWLGLSLAVADSQATRIAVEHGGEPAATAGDSEYAAAAVVEFHFASLMTTVGRGAVANGDERTRFERGAAMPRLTGNDPSHDRAITIFALLNLGAALLADHWLAPRRHLGHGWWMAWLVGAAVPIGFSCVLLVAPLLRLPLFALRKARVLVASRRARVTRAIVGHVRKHAADGVSMERLVTSFADDPRLPAPTHTELSEVAVDLGGTFDLDSADDPGRTLWRFPRLAAELSRRASPAGKLVEAKEVDG